MKPICDRYVYNTLTPAIVNLLVMDNMLLKINKPYVRNDYGSVVTATCKCGRFSGDCYKGFKCPSCQTEVDISNHNAVDMWRTCWKRNLDDTPEVTNLYNFWSGHLSEYCNSLLYQISPMIIPELCPIEEFTSTTQKMLQEHIEKHKQVVINIVQSQCDIYLDAISNNTLVSTTEFDNIVRLEQDSNIDFVVAQLRLYNDIAICDQYTKEMPRTILRNIENLQMFRSDGLHFITDFTDINNIIDNRGE